MKRKSPAKHHQDVQIYLAEVLASCARGLAIKPGRYMLSARMQLHEDGTVDVGNLVLAEDVEHLI